VQPIHGEREAADIAGELTEEDFAAEDPEKRLSETA